MESGFINSLLKRNREAQENAFPEEEIDFEARVNRAYENPSTLEFTRAVEKAEELRKMGLTSGKLLKRGEKTAADLCGPDIVDVAVVVGALKKMEEIEKLKTKG